MKDTDKRHKQRPYTMDMWLQYYKNFLKYNNKELSRIYKVKITTIYKWNNILNNKYNEIISYEKFKNDLMTHRLKYPK